MLGLGLGVQKQRIVGGEVTLEGIFGVGNVINWDAQETSSVNPRQAASYNGTSQYFNSASTDFDKTDSSFTFGGWFYFTAPGGLNPCLGKWSATGNQRSYSLLINSLNQFQLSVSSDGITPQNVNSGATTISSNTWYFIVAVHDHVNDKIKLTVDGGAFYEANFSGGVFNSSTDFEIASYTSGSGRVYQLGFGDENFFYDKALSLAEIQALYNGGNGVGYGDLSDAQKTSLVSWYSFDSTTNITLDSHGTNTLTNNNGTPVADGKVVGTIDNTDPIYQVQDSFGSGWDVSQNDLGERPTYASSGVNGLPSIDGNGIDEWLRDYTGALTRYKFLHEGTESFTVLAVFNVTTTGTSQIYLGTRFSSAERGFAFFMGHSPQTVRVQISDGVTGNIVTLDATNTITYGANSFAICGYNKTTNEAEVYVNDVTTLDTQTPTGAFVAGDAGQDLSLMARHTGGVQTLEMEQFLGQMMIGRGKAPSEVKDDIREYITNRWGI